MCVDLATAGWPSVSSPYMQSIHSSAITAISQVNNVTRDLVDRLQELSGAREGEETRWPVSGGIVDSVAERSSEETIVITGHEDGSVKFWLSKHNLMTHLTTFDTKQYFRGEDDFDDDFEREDDDEEEWPPFKKVGQFDPYSDDPRLAVKKVMFCGQSGVLVVGHGLLDVGSGRSNHSWRHHDELTSRSVLPRTSTS